MPVHPDVSRRARFFQRAPLLLVCAAIVWRLRVLLPLHTLPARGDPGLPFRAGDLTPQFVPWLSVAIDALWRHGTLAFWDRFTNSGAPEFASPQAGVISLATLLGGVAPLDAAVKWSILAHVAAGMLGVDALARRLRIDAPFAALGAFAFALGTYLLDHLHVGHLDHVYAMGLTPWALFFIWTAMERRDAWVRPAVAAGIVLGLEVLEGAASALVYSLIACCLIVVAVPGLDWRRWTVRVLEVGAIAAACFVGTASPQLLPMQEYVAATGRGGGLTLSQSMTMVREVAHPMPTTAAAALMCVGFAGLCVSRQRRAALWLAAIVAVAIAAANSAAVYGFLWRFFPGVRYQRIPQRALILVGIAGPVLVAAGAHTLWNALLRWRTAGMLAACLAIGWVVYESWSIAPSMPPMADPRVEQRENHAMRWLAEHAAGSRIHLWEPPTRHWLPDNITVPLGLETINSYTPAEHRDYRPGDFDPPGHRTFLGDAYSSPSRFWGLLNVRYVLSTTPQSERGFHLAAHVDRCPLAICQPEKASGPYIYENEKWMPRAWVASHAVALIGESEVVYEAALDLLQRPDFDPARVAVLQLRKDAPIPHVDRAFTVGFEMPGALRWRTGPADDALERALQTAPEPIAPAQFRRLGPNRLEITAPSDGWLIVSETLALYPGWSAAIKRKSIEMFRADGVLTAMKVVGGDVVRASYEPPRFRVGVAVFLSMIGAMAFAEASRRRTRHRKTG